MPMKILNPFLTILFFLMLIGHSTSQSIADTELATLANKLLEMVEDQMIGQNIAIADFVDMDDEPSNLGKYLAEEFSYTLVEKAEKFMVVDRTKLRKLLKEAEIGEKGMIDPQSISRIDRLEGITAVIYGKLIPVGNYIKVFIKVVILEKQINVITVRGELTRTPTIENLLGQENRKDTEVGKPASPVNSKLFFTKNHIQIVLNSCSRRGTFLDCEFQITSLNQADNFSIKKAKTRIIGLDGKTYLPYLLNMNGQQSQVQVNQPLKANTPVIALIQFAGIPDSIHSFSGLEIECNSSAAYSFTAQIQNIIIQN